MPCKVCGRSGCNSRRHANKCTLCGVSGHNKRFHTRGSDGPVVGPAIATGMAEADRGEAANEGDGGRLSRRSKSAVCQAEIDMATRVLVGLQKEKEKKECTGNLVERYVICISFKTRKKFV